MEPFWNIREDLLRKQKVYLSFIVVVTILLLLALNLGSWLFLNRMGHYLDGELAKRLCSIADLSADMIEELVDQYYPTFGENTLVTIAFLIEPILSRVQDQNQLEGVYIIDEVYRVLAEGRRRLPLAGRRTYVQEDSLSLKQAWTGITAASPLHVVAGQRFKSAYAPVKTMSNEVMAILVIEANADFFSILRFFRRGLIIGGLVSLGVLILFSSFLFWAISLLIKTHESMRRSERLALMGQMAATLAHEIRNPLRIINATVDVLKDKYDDRGQPDELFEYIPSEVKRLNRLVNDFLSFTREPQLNKKPGDLPRTLSKAIAALDHECREMKVHIATDIPATLPSINFDEDAVQQVVYNLLLNAIQSMPDGGNIFVRLVPVSKKGKKYVSVAVEDTGSGIVGDITRIFEPFYTTKTTGSGLGLAISKRTIEKHGGWIEVDSQKGVGTKIRFYLPVDQN
ncbi:MAG: ATP-binding protein [candidate division KSB1 bacterium]|nr:ATP-binding protein [candidate division KSB1 bacterium]